MKLHHTMLLAAGLTLTSGASYAADDPSRTDASATSTKQSTGSSTASDDAKAARDQATDATSSSGTGSTAGATDGSGDGAPAAAPSSGAGPITTKPADDTKPRTNDSGADAASKADDAQRP